MYGSSRADTARMLDVFPDLLSYSGRGHVKVDAIPAFVSRRGRGRSGSGRGPERGRGESGGRLPRRNSLAGASGWYPIDAGPDQPGGAGEGRDDPRRNSLAGASGWYPIDAGRVWGPGTGMQLVLPAPARTAAGRDPTAITRPAAASRVVRGVCGKAPSRVAPDPPW